MMVRELAVNHPSFVQQVQSLLEEGRKVQFRVRGWSMRPFIEHERDVVVVAPCEREHLRVGQVVLARVSQEHCVLHRIVQTSAMGLVLQGDGNVGLVEHCQREDVVGLAVGFYRKNRQYMEACTGWKWRFYSALWRTLRPFRRYLLAVYRHCWLPLFG